MGHRDIGRVPRSIIPARQHPRREPESFTRCGLLVWPIIEFASGKIENYDLGIRQMASACSGSMDRLFPKLAADPMATVATTDVVRSSLFRHILKDRVFHSRSTSVPSSKDLQVRDRQMRRSLEAAIINGAVYAALLTPLQKASLLCSSLFPSFVYLFSAPVDFSLNS